jgi:hypothetical protein
LFDEIIDISLTKPSLWPGDNGSETRVSVAWDNTSLYLLYDIYGTFKEPTAAADAPKDTILRDDRCEVFIVAPSSSAPSDNKSSDEWQYYCWEVNRGGRAMDFKAKWGHTFDYTWTSNYKATFIPAPSTASSPPSTTSTDDAKTNGSGLVGNMLLTIAWKDIGISDINSFRSQLNNTIRCGIYRAQSYTTATGGHDFIWTSWIDSQLTDVNFHRIESFGMINLLD